MKDKLAAGILSLALLIAGWLVHTTPQMRFGNATPGLASFAATTSSDSLAANTSTAIAATSTCVARIVTTSGVSGVMLLFTDKAGNTLTGTLGTALQAASTTVAYDSGQYGCGLVRAFSYGAQVINITDEQ